MLSLIICSRILEFVPMSSAQFPNASFSNVVRFALNRSMSPLMIMQYKEQLKIGSVIQRSLVEFCDYIIKTH